MIDPAFLNFNKTNSKSNFRQSEERQDVFSSRDTSDYAGNFRYTQLLDRSASAYSNDNDSSLVENSAPAPVVLHQQNQQQDGKNLTHLFANLDSKMVKSDSDQKIPDSGSARDLEYYYVNKNGYSSKSSLSPPPATVCETKSKQPTISTLDTNFLLEIYINNKGVLNEEINGAKMNVNAQERLSINNRSVPSHNMNHSNNSLNISPDNTIMQRDIHGNVIINTSMAIQEPNLDISYDHVKYINLFSILCCWCFPITGIISIVYARLTKKFFNRRDLVKAKKYLDKSEWFLILTFFFGFTLISIGFCLLEFYWFKNDTSKSPNKVYTLPRGFLHK